MDTTKEFTAVEFCAGYGGIHLGIARVIPNLRVIAFSEIEAFAIANLVAKMEAGLVDSAPIWTNLKTFPCEQFCDRVDLLVAGYPCQPFSHAGKRGGTEDPRHLWPSIQRAIQLIRPRYCFFENVEGHLTLGFKDVCHDLDGMGYVVTAGLFTAAEVGAPHKRKRLFILAHGLDRGESQQKGGERKQRGRIINGGKRELAHSEQPGLQGHTGDGTGCSRQERKISQSDRPISEGSLQRTKLAHTSSQGCDRRSVPNRTKKRSISQSAQCERPTAMVRSKFKRCCDLWPSRPGESQHEWEPPRVVDDSTRKRFKHGVNNDGTKQRNGDKSGQSGQADGEVKSIIKRLQGLGYTIEPCPDEPRRWHIDGYDTCSSIEGLRGILKEELENTERPDKERRQSARSETPGRRSHGESGRSDIQQDGKIKSAVGRNFDGPPGGMDYAKLCVSCDNRTDELRLLGNGVVPAVAAKAWQVLYSELQEKP